MPGGQIILLAPIAPASTGNGLAMRCQLFRTAAAAEWEVLTVVVPVAGQGAGADLVVPLDPQLARRGIVELLAQPRWRRLLAAAAPLSAAARQASAGLAGAAASLIREQLDGTRAQGMHVMRAYLAPLGLALAEDLGLEWVALDLDDDDAALAAQLGDAAAAGAHERLLATFAREFMMLSAASPIEARTLAARVGRPVHVIPNAVPLGAQRPATIGGRERARLLFVGNLTYRPNIDAARRLATEILPEVRRLLGPAVELRLVGRPAPELRALAGDGVQLAGYVPDLAGEYADADVVVAPLSAGGGTRIKLLEAFAHQTPVVASPQAVAGLEAVHGRHLLLAADCTATAEAVVRLLRDRALAASLVREARALVAARYDTGVVGAEIRDFLRRAAAAAAAQTQAQAEDAEPVSSPDQRINPFSVSSSNAS